MSVSGFAVDVGDVYSPGSERSHSNRSQDCANKFHSLIFGPRLLKSFNQPKHRTEIRGMTYNGRSQRFIILDSRGCSSWSVSCGCPSLKRELAFPKYHFNIIIKILYCKKMNVYFGLGKDYALRVYNKDFKETERATTESRNLVTHLLFNPVRNELITCGDCVRFWSYQQMETDTFNQHVSMANYGLVLRQEFLLAQGRWCTRMDLDVARQHLYCFSDLSLLCYDMEGTLVSQLKNTKQGMVLASIFAPYSRMLLTASVDFEIKAWSEASHLLHVFEGHNRPVTNLVLHPDTPSIFISGSLDGTIRLWCLDTLTQLCSIMCVEGFLGLGLTEEGLLYAWSLRNMQLYQLNHFLDFWSHLRYPALSFTLCKAQDKTTRLLTLGEGNSLHIFSCTDGKKLCMMPPHPFLSPLKVLPNFAYGRASGVIALLLSSWEIWVYTARTDPVCLVAVLDIRELQQLNAYIKPKDRACVKSGQGVCAPSLDVSCKKSQIWECSSLGFLSSPVCYWTGEGLVCADATNFILCGMKDGRILFMDVIIRNLKYCEIKVHKDPVVWMSHDVDHGQLLNMCVQSSSKLVQIWSLPMLEPLHQVTVHSDVTVFSRMNSLLCLGFQSGAVEVVSFQKEESRGRTGGWAGQANPHSTGDGGMESSEAKHDHQGAVLSVDSCSALLLFLSCGADSLIKLWDEQRSLLAEVQLDSSLSCACFLNPLGDLLVGFRLNLFRLSHHHLLPSALNKSSTSQASLTESYIYENPCLTFDNKKFRKDMDPIDMENYIDSKSSVDEMMPAPSLTYQSLPSPISSRSALSFRTLLLTPGQSTTDLIQILAQDQLLRQQSPQPAESTQELVQSEETESWEVQSDILETAAAWSVQSDRITIECPDSPKEEHPSTFLKPSVTISPPPVSVENVVPIFVPTRIVKEPSASRFANICITIPDIHRPTVKIAVPRPPPLPVTAPPAAEVRRQQCPQSQAPPPLPTEATKAPPTQVPQKARQPVVSRLHTSPGTVRGSQTAVVSKSMPRESTSDLRQPSQGPQRRASSYRPPAAKGQKVKQKESEDRTPKKTTSASRRESSHTRSSVPDRRPSTLPISLPSPVADPPPSHTLTSGRSIRFPSPSEGPDITIVDVSLLPSITQHQMSSTLVKVNTDKRSAKDRAKKGRRTRRHSALRQLGNSVESWIEKELLRHEYLQKVQRERTQQAHESRGDLELQRLQQWVNQPHHTRCWSAHPGGYERHIFDALGSRQCEQGRYLRTCPTIQLHNVGTPPSHLPPPSHAASPPLVSPCHPTAKTLHQAWDSKEDQPYRLPMSHLSLPRTMEHKPVTREELWEVDRKAGILLLQRPNSGNSIPSKGRYTMAKALPILVKHPNSQLEERLLRDRFPKHYRALLAKSTSPTFLL